jgi:hypothetical protein
MTLIKMNYNTKRNSTHHKITRHNDTDHNRKIKSTFAEYRYFAFLMSVNMLDVVLLNVMEPEQQPSRNSKP